MTQELSPAIQAMLSKNANVNSVESMESGGGGVPRISLKKSRFTAKNGDDELKLGESINVVIVGISPPTGFTKTYYANGYTPGAADAPDCSSDDGIRPSRNVSNPVSDLCRTCKNSQWGSAVSMSGGKAKACKDSKRLYVRLAEELGDDTKPTYLLGVSVMSLKPFGAYGKLLAREGIPTPSIVITQLGFNEEASVPQLTFNLIGVLDDDNATVAMTVAEAKEWDQTITAPTQAALPQAAPAVDSAEASVAAPPATTEQAISDGLSQW